jgi:hypothetical protein
MTYAAEGSRRANAGERGQDTMTITHPDAATMPRLLDRLFYLERKVELAMLDGDARDLGPERLEVAVLRSELYRRGVEPDADDPDDADDAGEV